MKLEEINKIEQETNIDVVNDLLNKGYRIIKVFHQHVETQDGVQSYPVYILGKEK